MSLIYTDKQKEALKVVGGHKYSLLHGGSRSGKTLLYATAIIHRAIKEESKHAVFRLRLKHMKPSLWLGTFPAACKLMYPDLYPEIETNSSDFFWRLPNGSEIWFAGLDDKDRVEKVLGTEYATLYFNECSQIPYGSVSTAMTRLAQKTSIITPKAFFDCNPPTKRHWAYKMFFMGEDPESGKALQQERYGQLSMNPVDNMQNLTGDYLETLEALPEAKRKRFQEGIWLDDNEDSLWQSKHIKYDDKHNDLMRVVIAIDPAVSKKDTSDETGIIAAGKQNEDKGFVLGDYSGRYTVDEWASAAIRAYERHNADLIVAEVNNGGDLVESVLRGKAPNIPFRAIRASRGKHVRAEPVASLYQQGKICHSRPFPDLEEQMLAFTPEVIEQESPDRADALVYAITELFLNDKAVFVEFI